MSCSSLPRCYLQQVEELGYWLGRSAHETPVGKIQKIRTTCDCLPRICLSVWMPCIWAAAAQFIPLFIRYFPALFSYP